jgi:hypothetical protein
MIVGLQDKLSYFVLIVVIGLSFSSLGGGMTRFRGGH